MQTTKILEMLNQGRIDELKAALQDEIYTESLKGKADAKKRYAAMKRYFKYSDSGREILERPCEVEIEGSKYNAFCNTFSLALTKEQCGEIPMCEDPARYPSVTRLVNYNGDEGKLDIHKVIAEAKSKGYKLKKSEIGFGYKYMMHYDGSYFKIGLVDITHGIIDDGKEAIVYHVSGNGKPMTITTDIGVCVIMPVRYDGNPEDEGIVVIEAK